jgi:hypothetical protein
MTLLQRAKMEWTRVRGPRQECVAPEHERENLEPMQAFGFVLGREQIGVRRNSEDGREVEF